MPNICAGGAKGATVPEEYLIVLKSGGENLKPVYEWSVYNGKILSGIGTDKVIIERDEDRPLTVKINVLGLPDGCSYQESETSTIDKVRTPHKLSEFAGSLNKISQDKFEQILVIINSDPSVLLLCVISGTRNKTVSSIKKKQEFLQNVIFAKLNDRIRFLVRETTDDRVDLWAVPAGADYPKYSN